MVAQFPCSREIELPIFQLSDLFQPGPVQAISAAGWHQGIYLVVITESGKQVHAEKLVAGVFFRWHNFFAVDHMAQADHIFNEKGFDSQKISCSNCGWEGTGAETKLIDYYGLGKSKQVNCPRCDTNLGSLPSVNTILGGTPDTE